MLWRWCFCVPMDRASVCCSILLASSQAPFFYIFFFSIGKCPPWHWSFKRKTYWKWVQQKVRKKRLASRRLQWFFFCYVWTQNSFQSFTKLSLSWRKIWLQSVNSDVKRTAYLPLVKHLLWVLYKMNKTCTGISRNSVLQSP